MIRECFIVVAAIFCFISLAGQTAEEWFYKGYELEKKEQSIANLELQISYYTRAVELEPNFPEAFNNRGVAKMKLGKIEDALEDFNESIELASNYFFPYLNRGKIRYENQKNLKAAMSDFESVIKLKPDDTLSYYYLGLINGDLRNTEVAIKNYDKAIELDASFIDAYFQRAWEKSFLGYNEEAIEDYTKAITLNSNFVAAYNNRGNCKEKLDQFDAALEDYYRSINIDSTYVFGYKNIGYWNQKFGKHKEAIIAFNNAIKCDPIRAELYFARSHSKKELGRILEANEDLNIANILTNFQKKDEIFYKGASEGDIKTEEKKPTVQLLCVGLSNYQYPTMSSLETPVQNVYEFKQIIEKSYPNHQTKILSNKNATKDDILESMKDIFLNPSKINEEDIVIFYFSGHGTTIEEKIGICPYDYFDLAQFISEEEIIALIQKSPAKNKICIIEACKTKTKSMNSLSLEFAKRINEKREKIDESTVFITSTEAGKESYEYSDIGTVFSYYLLQGMKGKADLNEDKIITIKELFDYIKPRVSNKSRKTQVPQINNDGYRDIPFLILK